MYTEERMERMASSRYNYYSADKEQLDEMDKKILSHPEKLTPEEMKEMSFRIRMLKNAGYIRCGSDNNGNETLGTTSTTKLIS